MYIATRDPGFAQPPSHPLSYYMLVNMILLIRPCDLAN